MRTIVHCTENGELAFPRDIMEQAGICPGDTVCFELSERAIEIRKCSPSSLLTLGVRLVAVNEATSAIGGT